MKKFVLLLFFLLSISSNSLGFIRDSEIENLIKEIVEPIADAAGQKKENLEIFIINDNQLNAFVTPGQKIFIFTGLITNSKNSNALEGVIAHELGHITGIHHVKIYEQIEKSRAITLVGLILGTAVSAMTGDPDAAAAIAGGALSTSTRSLLSFTRAQEGSADQAGFKFLKKSGKSLCGIIGFLELLENMQVSYQKNAYTQSHPLTRERIIDAKNAAKNENCEINNKTKKTAETIDGKISIDERYKFIQAKLIGFTDPENTLSSIKNNSKFNEYQKMYALSIANYKLFNLQKGNELINKLIKKYPSNPYFYELKAQMLRENGFLKESLNGYLIVNKLLPNDPLVKIELAHTLLNIDSKENINKAIKILLEAQKKESENNKLWYLLSVAHGRNSEMAKSKYASAYSFYLKGDDAMALNFIKNAKKIVDKNSVTWVKLNDLENKINSKKK